MKINNCPLCGKECKITEEDGWIVGLDKYSVIQCTSCLIRSGRFEDANDAIKWWNNLPQKSNSEE